MSSLENSLVGDVRNDRTVFITAAAVFFLYFGLYVYSTPGSLAPYRDAGEMTSVLKTLGVAHPPGYPLYTLLGHVALQLPVGDMAHRAALFSAFCGALGLALLFLYFRSYFSTRASLAAVFVLGVSHPLWDLCTVQEMYALGFLWLALLLYVDAVWKKPLLLAFLMGLGLGVRMDALLFYVFFIPAFIPIFKTKRIFYSLAAFGAGLSVFLTLMIRSKANPWLDWANPDTLSALFDSMTRRRYAGTLDLLSLSYATGENFLVGLRHFFQVSGFGMLAAGLVPFVGFFALYKYQRILFFRTFLTFLLCGPGFIFLANMPPNPHALAILEASYIGPQLLLALAMAAGFSYLEDKIRPKIMLAVLLLALGFLCFYAGWPRGFKRHQVLLRDYMANVWRSVPPDSTLVMKKDVTLFSAWHDQLVNNVRPDVGVLPQGLSGSPWYWEMKKRWPTRLGLRHALKEDSDWREVAVLAQKENVLIGYDAEWPSFYGDVLKGTGFAASIGTAPYSLSLEKERMLGLYLFRDEAPGYFSNNFFSEDLRTLSARAASAMGHRALLLKEPDVALWFFKKATTLDPAFPLPLEEEAYLFFSRGDYGAAEKMAERAVLKNEEQVAKTVEFRSLPPVRLDMKRSLSQSLITLGAAREKLKNLTGARDAYLRAIQAWETAQAHFNLAVTYWNENEVEVEAHLKRALEIDPSMREAAYYLSVVRAKQSGTQKGKR